MHFMNCGLLVVCLQEHKRKENRKKYVLFLFLGLVRNFPSTVNKRDIMTLTVKNSIKSISKTKRKYS